MSESLNVFLFDKKVGILNRTEPDDPYDIEFIYDNDYTGLPISNSMPKEYQYFNQTRTYSFFQNLLPEESLFRSIAKRKRFAYDNVFDALKVLGKECAGAIIITYDSEIINDNQYENCIAEILEELQKENCCLALLPKANTSLAGAQDKIAVYIKDDNFYFPKNYAPTSHILKHSNIFFQDLVYNESFCLNLARNMGLSACENKIYTFDNCSSILCITRYDRENNQRLHQEDFCQCMGLYRSAKYQADSNWHGIRAVRECAEDLNLDIRKNLLNFMLFSYFIGNNDWHLKNLSVLYNIDGTASFAPFYDLVSTEVYKNVSLEMAIAFGMHYFKSEVTRSDLFALLSDLDLSIDEIDLILAEYFEKLPIALEKTKEAFNNIEIIDKISKIVTDSILLAKKTLCEHNIYHVTS